MIDSRAERLGRLVVDYSLALCEGHVFRIDSAAEESLPLVMAVYEHALQAGAHPYVQLSLDGAAELLLLNGSDDQIAYVSPGAAPELEELDALFTIWSDVNTRALSGVDPARQQLMLDSRHELSKRRTERIFSGDMRWCGTLFPTSAHAQDAGMSVRAYEEFVYGACHVLGIEDAADHWRATSAALTARASQLDTASELHIVGPDTDLWVGVEGRKWIAADGRLNMPDGEVFTSPLEDATHGEIRYTFPAIFQGREVEDVRLRFDAGRVVEAEAAGGGDYLDSILELEGADILGEVAFGLNYEIDRFTQNILFDEKIGGTMHLALGASFPMTGGVNSAPIHWDMICDLREDGEVYADGELVWRAGQFLDDVEATT